MASITLTIPDAQVSRVIAALCASRVVPGTTDPLPANAANAKAVVMAWVKEEVLRYEKRLAEQQIIIDVETIVS